MPEDQKSNAPDVSADSGTPSENRLNLAMLMNVSLPVRIRFGATTVLFRDVLNLYTGDRIELDRPIEDPVDVMIGDKVVAQGEVVVVDGCYAVKIQRIVNPGDRLESLELG